MERRLAVILAADMVGCTSLLEADQERGVRILQTLLGTCIEPIFAAQRGRIIRKLGDGVLAEFSSVVGTVAAAIAMQEAVKAAHFLNAAGTQISYRVGVNISDVIVDGDDLLGDDMNVAARLEQQARPGGICLSAAAYDQIAGKLDITIENMGPLSLENLVRPVRAYQVLMPGDVAEAPLKPPVSRCRTGLVIAGVVVVVLALGALGYMSLQATNTT